MRLIVARCEVVYSGCLATRLPMGELLAGILTKRERYANTRAHVGSR